MGEIKSLEVPLECPICRSAPQIGNRPATAISWVGVSIVHCCDLSIGADDEIAAISHWNALCLGYRRALSAIPAAEARAEALREAAAVAFTASTSKAPATERKKIAAAIRALIPEKKPSETS